MFRRAGIIVLAAALGTGASAGIGACGEKRGSVSIEGGASTATAPTGTSPTETGPKTTTAGK